MTTPQEIEFKILIEDEAAARRFVEVARARVDGPEDRARQVNHFFDTPARDLHRARFAVRLREARGRTVLTLKGAGVEAVEGVPSARPEEEAVVAASDARRVLDGERDALDLARDALPPGTALLAAIERAAGGTALTRVGSFSNERQRIGPFSCGDFAAVLEVDRTEFPGGRVDHEVELEVPASAVAEGRALLEELLGEAGLPWRTSTSKAARFFAILGG